ncbi:MAG: PQQ-binding-like beta-propeller repeat protein [Planctomycetota bacterium]|nr:PQQ-binding-like beta-propeller repeat protein [Planctomycetota bacterium]
MLQRISTLGLWIAVSFVALQTASFGQQTGKPRSLFAADYEKKIAAVVKPDNSLGLQMPIQAIHDAQPLPNGNWLLQTNFTEVVEVNSDGKEVWKYKPAPESGKAEIHAFRRLESGLTMVAESGTTRIIEVNQDGKIVHTTPLKVSVPNPHRDTRLVRITPAGTYLVAHEGEKCVREYDREGKIVWEYEVGSQLYSAVRLANGNTLVGTGDGHRVIEVNQAKEIVWELKENELAGVKLAWVTMVDRLPNGNTWIVNCHAGPNNPQILEVTPEKKVVWSFKDFKRFGNALPVAIALD